MSITKSEKEKNELDLPWFEKYRPQSTKQMVGFNNHIEKIAKFLKNFRIKLRNNTLTTKDRSILLEGPPGIGKTTVVYAIANDLGYSVVEMNASDARTEESIKKKLNESVSSTNLMAFMGTKEDIKKKSRKKIIFIDEVDGISGQSDRGGLSTLIKIIEKTKNPIIMACNFYNSKFKSLYDITEKIKCNTLKKPSIKTILQRIVKAEGLKIDENSILQIAMNSGGDLRSAINDLQALAQGGKNLSEEGVLNVDMHRDIEEKIFSFIETMFKQKTLFDARKIASNTDVDYNFLYKVVYSNLTNFVTESKDRLNALENLADADVIMGRIRKNMDYSMLPYYFDYVSGGVTLSVEYPKLGGYKRFIFPRTGGNPLKFVDNPLAEEIQNKYHISKRDAMISFVPYLKELVKSGSRAQSAETISQIAKELNFDEKKLKKFI